MSEKRFTESDDLTLKVIARIYNDFPTKFGLPRQSGLASSLISKIVFESEYRLPEALRNIEEYSHLWLIWGFSEAFGENWSPTVRPPRLGGNKRVGVFATRAPYRPNPIGLSSVKLEGIEKTADGHILIVSGADIMNGSPIYDIKPYLPYVDIHADASDGFTSFTKDFRLDVDFPKELLERIPEKQRDALLEVLSGDPRPSYHRDPNRVYGLAYSKYDVKFTVNDRLLKVVEISDRKNDNI